MLRLKNDLSIKPKVKLIKKTLIIEKIWLVAANKTRRKDVCLISLFIIGKMNTIDYFTSCKVKQELGHEWHEMKVPVHLVIFGPWNILTHSACASRTWVQKIFHIFYSYNFWMLNVFACELSD